MPPTLVPAHPQLGNYSTAWSDADLGRLLWNTTFYAVGALAFQLVFDVGAAYAFSKLRPVFGNVVLFADAGDADDPRPRCSPCRPT